MRPSAVFLLMMIPACEKPPSPSPAASSTSTSNPGEGQGLPSPSTATSTATATATSTSTSTSTSTPTSTSTSDAAAIPIPDAASPADAAPSDFLSYTNSRYGFTIDYPSLMKKNPASANDAGQSFSWKSKASMRAWGFANSAHLTPKSLFDDWARRAGVTTKDQDAVGWTVGGVDRGKDFYSRCIYGADVVVCVEIQYDDDVKEQLAPIAKHVAESLKAKTK